MLRFIKQTWLGLLLIALSSGTLLLSDLDHRNSAVGKRGSNDRPRIAIMQITSTRVLDDTVKGILEGLREGGYHDPQTAHIRCFNASGDYTTAKAMADDLVSGGYDMIITSGTPTLQSVAAANKERKVPHVFGAVTDPYGSGVNISGPAPDQHPPHLVGVGTFQPVENAFIIAKRMYPDMKRVGTIWNPGEHNSEACVLKAREICLKLGIQLFEANANNSSEVPEALRAVLTRGVDAVWIGGDTVVNAANSNIIDTCRQSGIAVFTNDPGDAASGAIFALGASYREVGLTVARMACSLLKGADARQMRVDNVVPERLVINEKALQTFSSHWSLDNETRLKAAASVAKAEEGPKAKKPEPGRMYKVGILYYAPHAIFDENIRGIKEALAEIGYIEGRNIRYTLAHANGDMSILQQTVSNMAHSDLDVIVPLSTPCLAAVAAQVKEKNVVFADVTEPVGAGAGKSFEDHLPNVTGAVWPAPMERGFQIMQELFPGIKKMGVIYNPGEANARTEVALAKEYTAKLGVELVQRPVSSTNEVPEALTSIFAEKLDAFFLQADNAVLSAQPIIAEACRKNGIPLLADDDSCMGQGALLSVGINPYEHGRYAGGMISRVLLGESPANIPFTPTEEVDLSLDLRVAARLGVTIPNHILKEANIFHNVAQRFGRPAKIAIVNMADNPALNAAQGGLLIGLKRSGLVEGRDFTLRYYNAQGEFVNISQTLDTAINSGVDLIFTVGTPTAQILASKSFSCPAVFTVSSNPADIGITDVVARGVITGSYEDPPIRELLDFARAELPGLSRIGIIYTPAEINSVIAYNKLREECAKDGITLIERGVASVTDLSEAARSLETAKVQAILTSADNLMSTSLAAVLKVTRPAGIPIIGNDLELVKMGADACIGHSYEDWGIESGIMGAKILAGLPMLEQAPRALSTESLRIVRRQEAHTPAASPLASKPLELRIVAYNDTVFVEESHRGLMDAIRASTMREGVDYKVRMMNAQGDMGTLSSIMTSVSADNVDLLMCISTPALQAALRQAGNTKIVFTSVGDGVQAGAGKSETEHLPNVTGITTRSPFEDMSKLIRRLMPNAKKVGTLFTPAEINSVLYKDWLAQALDAEGMRLVAVPVNSSADTSEAAAALCRGDIDLVCQILDNTTRPGFAAIVRHADQKQVPTFCFEKSQMRYGPVLALARDYYDAGYEAGQVAIRVLRGEDPAKIPFSNSKTLHLVLNNEALNRYGISVPEDIASRAREDASKLHSK